MTKPVIMAVDEEAEVIEAVKGELEKRYSADYQILTERSPGEALRTLETLKAAGVEVAILVADHWLPEMTGVEFMTRAQDLYPQARRAVMVRWGDRPAVEAVLPAMTLGRVDSTVPRPWGSLDEQFHKLITDFLEEWSRAHRPHFEVVQVVGEQWSPRCHELRDLLERNRIPYGFYDKDTEEGKSLLELKKAAAGTLPVVLLSNGMVFQDPSNMQLADALQVNTHPEERLYDLTIVGAGPAGLSAAVYGASEGLFTMVVEREAIGGQAGSSSLIRNYLGFPRGISGSDLASRAYNQAWMFGADFYFTREAQELQVQGDERILLLSDGTRIRSRSLVLALGVAYRRLAIPSLDGLTGVGVFYGSSLAEAPALKGEQVFVAGGGNSAGQAAVHLAKYVNRVTMLVRESSLAENMSEYLIQEIRVTGNIEVLLNTEVIGGQGEHRLQGLVLQDSRTGAIEVVPTIALFVLIGSQPYTDWLPRSIQRDEFGYIKTGLDLLQGGEPPQDWPLDRPPLSLETCLPGVFAAGDARYQAVKRVASAVGEGSIAIQQVHQYLGGT